MGDVQKTPCSHKTLTELKKLILEIQRVKELECQDAAPSQQGNKNDTNDTHSYELLFRQIHGPAFTKFKELVNAPLLHLPWVSARDLLCHLSFLDISTDMDPNDVVEHG